MFEVATQEMRRVAAMDPREFRREDVVPAIRALAQLRSMAEGAIAGLTMRLEADQIHADDQYGSAAACLAAETNVSRPMANRVVQQARAFRDLPATLDALQAGTITIAHAEVLMGAMNLRTRAAMAIDEREAA